MKFETVSLKESEIKQLQYLLQLFFLYTLERRGHTKRRNRFYDTARKIPLKRQYNAEFCSVSGGTDHLGFTVVDKGNMFNDCQT